MSGARDAGQALQAGIAARYGGNYGLALAVVIAVVAVAIALLTGFGREAKGIAFGGGRVPPAPANAT